MATDAIDTALVGKLAADATLAGYAPGGVWWAVAPPGTAEPFVVVDQLASEDEDVLPGTRRFDDRRYTIRAVAQASSASGTDDAAGRILAVLDHGTLTLTGLRLLLMRRESRVRYLETDGDRRYQHSGGVYRVLVAVS